MIAYLIAGVTALALVSGLAYKTYQAGADAVRLEWQADVAARKAEAEAERVRQDALRATQDRETTRRLTNARKSNQTLLQSLEAHIRAAGTAAKCPIPPSLLDDWNRANAGPEGISTGTVPSPGRTSPPAR